MRSDVIAISDCLSFDVYNTLKHFARVSQSLRDVCAAAEVTELQETIRDGLSMGVDVRHQIVLTFRAQDHFSVVVKKVYLETKKIHRNYILENASAMRP